MKVTVRVKPRSKKPGVTQIDSTTFIVAVKEAPVDNAANKAVEKAIAEYFNIAPSRMQIVKGHTNRTKIVEIF